jgi:hypothetical protein
MIDPQRFQRGVDIRPSDLEPVMVRRLKSDLRAVNIAGFPKRIIEPIAIDGLPSDAPELYLARRLAEYGDLRDARIAALPPSKASSAKLAFVGLQQRLLSSVAAFAKTLEVHRRTLAKVADGQAAAEAATLAAQAFVTPDAGAEQAELNLEGLAAEAAIDANEEATAEAATIAGAASAAASQLAAELSIVDEMLRVAHAARGRSDARVERIVDWVFANMINAGVWNRRRLIIFTEYEDTRRWLERRLREAVSNTDRADDRIEVFTGATGQERRDAIKLAFNADPDKQPMRILICTDAAREGINLQTRCSDLIHFDLPWNPARLEQRNGRIDRKLQPAPVVTCRYFRYAQREADVVLDALVRKTRNIHEELGSAGQVLEARITRRLAETGIARGQAAALAKAIEQEADERLVDAARREMDDEEARRRRRLLRDEEDLRGAMEGSRERVGVEANELRRVAATALGRAGFDLDAAHANDIGVVPTFRLDPTSPAFASDPSWADAFDDLRSRPRKRGERLSAWRRDAPVRAIAFSPPIMPDGRDADGVVQVHLEHRLVRRLIARFLSQGFADSLSRVSIIEGVGAQPRVVVMGRLAIFGAGAARLHEEIIQVTALWTEADRERRPLRPLGEAGAGTTLDQLEKALETARPAGHRAAARIKPLIRRDIADLVPTLKGMADRRLAEVSAALARRGEEEAADLTNLLEQQRRRLSDESARLDAASRREPGQQLLDLWPEKERREREANRRHWGERLEKLELELETEPARLRDGYRVRAHRLEPVGVLYLWPAA